jgi:hypothetical protein
MAPGTSLSGAPGKAEIAPPSFSDRSDQSSSGILPSTMIAAPEVPISGPNGWISRDQLTEVPPQPERSWRRRFLDAMSEENVRHYLGPGFYDFYRQFAGLAHPFSPGPSIQQAFADSGDAEQALKNDNYGKALLNYGTSTLNLGSALLPDAGTVVGKAVAVGTKALAAGSKALFGSIFSRIAPRDRLPKAIAMLRAGEPMNEIRLETGWFLDVDGIWKFEMPDHEMQFTLDRGGGWGVGGRTSAIQYPSLKKAYPDLRHVYFEYTPGPVAGGSTISQSNFGRPTFQKPTEIHVTGPVSELHAMTAHELQHPIQDMENFPRGGSQANAFDPIELEKADNLLRRADELRSQGKLSDAAILEQRAYNVIHSATNFDTYWRLAGEIEARNAATRALMTPEQRLAIPPWETIDRDAMPPIVRFRVPPPLPQTADWGSYRNLVDEFRRLGIIRKR